MNQIQPFMLLQQDQNNYQQNACNQMQPSYAGMMNMTEKQVTPKQQFAKPSGKEEQFTLNIDNILNG